mmetsp:Transcript_30761/g.74992  ORF Transcript_30761/g.74992 Transcript_30761/m.74992 type:complete len:273 (-) Transcript_30761:657-1475(-)
MNFDDLLAIRGRRERHANLHLKPSRPQQRRVDELPTIGEPNDQDVLQLGDAVHLRQELVADRVANPAIVDRAADLEHRIELVHDYDVQPALISFHSLFNLGLMEKPPNSLLSVSNKFAQHLRPAHDSHGARLQLSCDLPCEEGLPDTRRAVQKQSSDVLKPQLARFLQRNFPGSEYPPGNVRDDGRHSSHSTHDLLRVQMSFALHAVRDVWILREEPLGIEGLLVLTSFPLAISVANQAVLADFRFQHDRRGVVRAQRDRPSWRADEHLYEA